MLEVEILWVDALDSWIASSGPDGFTPSKEHRALTPVKTVTISLPQIHISRRFFRAGNNLGGLLGFKWGELTHPSVLDLPGGKLQGML